MQGCGGQLQSLAGGGHSGHLLEKLLSQAFGTVAGGDALEDRLQLVVGTRLNSA